MASVFRRVRDQARPAAGGTATWLVGVHEGAVRPLGPHVYDGTSGVAIFLAAYHWTLGDAEAADLALRAIAPLRAKLSQLPSARARSIPIGGAVGLGSFLYTFLLLARWLRRDELLRSACEAAALITPERILAEPRLDVVDGCAGALLALLRMESEPALPTAERARALELATLCGRNLVDRRAAQPGGWRAWPAPDSPALSGFAHGATGIGYALLRLFERTGQEALRAAALEGFAFERSLYDARARTWLDPRHGGRLEQAAWCHGAPGVALGRAASLTAAADEATSEDLARALAVIRELPDSQRDHVCCGNSGRVEILSTVGRDLGREDLVHAAWQRGRPLMARALSGDARLEGPSLFLGAAGLGYTLLRLGHPDRLPCLLLLE